MFHDGPHRQTDKQTNRLTFSKNSSKVIEQPCPNLFADAHLISFECRTAPLFITGIKSNPESSSERLYLNVYYKKFHFMRSSRLCLRGWGAHPWKLDRYDHVQIRLLKAGDYVATKLQSRFSGNWKSD